MNIHFPAETDDITAIRAVVLEETEAFVAKDFDRWAVCYAQDERTCEVYAGDVGVIVHQGWEAVAAAMRQLMADNPDALAGSFWQRDHQISVDRDMAWVTFMSACAARDQAMDVPHVFDMRVLERRQGRWKIVFSSVSELRVAQADDPVIQIEPDGTIAWATNRTLEALGAFQGLTVSGGRLRAAQRKWQPSFRDTLARAAKLRHLFEPSFTTQVGNQFVYPCMLGESDEGGVLHCTVFVRNGAINVSFNDETLILRKINAAAEVFGLSDGQKRLAVEVAKGHGLTDAACALGISINTARTHLTRIYEKTGVNSQTALVRLIMSMSSIG